MRVGVLTEETVGLFWKKFAFRDAAIGVVGVE